MGTIIKIIATVVVSLWALEVFLESHKASEFRRTLDLEGKADESSKTATIASDERFTDTETSNKDSAQPCANVCVHGGIHKDTNIDETR